MPIKKSEVKSLAIFIFHSNLRCLSNTVVSVPQSLKVKSGQPPRCRNDHLDLPGTEKAQMAPAWCWSHYPPLCHLIKENSTNTMPPRCLYGTTYPPYTIPLSLCFHSFLCTRYGIWGSFFPVIVQIYTVCHL